MGAKEHIDDFLSERPIYRNMAELYIPENETIEGIKTNIQGSYIKIFSGDWCPDCRIQLPTLISILLALDNDNIGIELIEIKRKMKDGHQKADEFNVHAIPIFIFLRDGREIGRIIERPRVSMARDILEIIGKSNSFL